MIKTEAKRSVVQVSDIRPPDAVLKAIKQYDKELELVFNTDDNRWEFYRIKQHGLTPGEDILHWQMSAPTFGSDIVIGIVDWLKKFDTSNHGMKSKAELEKEWISMVRGINERQRLTDQKRIDDVSQSWADLIKGISVARTQIAVPKIIGYNKRTGKRIYAIKKGKVKTIGR